MDPLADGTAPGEHPSGGDPRRAVWVYLACRPRHDRDARRHPTGDRHRGGRRCHPAVRIPDGTTDAVRRLGDDRENPNGEYLVFENAANATLDLSGWSLADIAGHIYVFPAGFTLAPVARVTVYTGQGDDHATDRYRDANGAVWNNDGDTAVVRTASGSLVLERSYG